jgi:hypothetical protein
LVYLSDDITTKGSVDCIENPDGIQSPSSKIDVAQSNGLLWRSGYNKLVKQHGSDASTPTDATSVAE